MEEKTMTLAIIGLVIGILVLCAGIYYLIKEKNDPESRKIYGMISLLGGALTLGMIVKLILSL